MGGASNDKRGTAARAETSEKVGAAPRGRRNESEDSGIGEEKGHAMILQWRTICAGERTSVCRGIQPLSEYPVKMARVLTTIRQYRDLPEALIARCRLESCGVSCILADENVIRMNW